MDVAQEMVNFTRLQILSQSGTAMLAQANQGAAERALAAPRLDRSRPLLIRLKGPPWRALRRPAIRFASNEK